MESSSTSKTLGGTDHPGWIRLLFLEGFLTGMREATDCGGPDATIRSVGVSEVDESTLDRATSSVDGIKGTEEESIIEIPPPFEDDDTRVAGGEEVVDMPVLGELLMAELILFNCISLAFMILLY